MKCLTVVCGLSLVLAGIVDAAGTKVYKKVTKDGTVIFSDQPIQGAEQIVIQTSAQTRLPTLQKAPTDPLGDPAPAGQFDGEIIIDAPQQEQTIRDSQGNFTVLSQVKPALPTDHRLQLFVNDAPWGEATQATVFKLTNIDRGETRVHIDLLNKDGKKIASSPVRTFYLHRSFTN